jgi:hypothetical protein
MTQPQPIAAALPCVQCAYDLRATDTTSRCPECGLSVAATHAHLRGEIFHPRPLQRITWGLGLLLLGSVLASLMLLTNIFMLVQMITTGTSSLATMSNIVIQYVYYIFYNWVPTLILITANLLLTARLTQSAPSFWPRLSLWYLRLYLPVLALWGIAWSVAVSFYISLSGSFSLNSPFYIVYDYVYPLLTGILTILGTWALLYRLGYLQRTIPTLNPSRWLRALRLLTAVLCLLPVALHVLNSLSMLITWPGHSQRLAQELANQFPFSPVWILIAIRASSLPTTLCLLTLCTIYLFRLRTFRAQNLPRWQSAQNPQ